MRKMMFVFMVLMLAGPATAVADGSVRIGIIEPLTGSVAYNGTSAMQGAKLAVEQRNANGGVLGGKKVKLLSEDGQCSTSNSVTAAERLIDKEKAVALIGAFCSSATAAVMPVAKRRKIPLLSGVSSAEFLTKKGNPYFFRSAGTDKLLSDAFSSLLVKDLGLKKVAYIGVNDDWGRGGVKAFSKAFSKEGVKQVMKEYFDHGTNNFYTLLTKLRASGANGVFVAAETQDGAELVKQMKQLGIQMKIFGVGSWATEDFIKLTGDASNGIYAAVPYVYTYAGKRNQKFVKAYKSHYNEKPGKYAAEGYNAANIMMEAIDRAGSTQSKKIVDALKKTDYNGPNGNFRFAENGQAYGFHLFLARIKNGKIKVADKLTVKKPSSSN